MRTTLRAGVGTLVITAAAIGLTAAPAAASPAPTAGTACKPQTFLADHSTGVVSWTITCSEAKDVVIDATAFSGTPDDHDIVDEQQALHHVGAGESWSATMRFDPAGVDQIRAQAVTFTDITDPMDPAEIIGGATG